MKLTKTAVTLFTGLLIGSIGVHAQTTHFENNPRWPINATQPAQNERAHGSSHAPQNNTAGNHQVRADERFSYPNNPQPRTEQRSQQATRQHSDYMNPPRYDERDYRQMDYRNEHHTRNNSDHFRRNERLSRAYRGSSGSRYVVEDWRDHRGLYAPPQGMRWSYIDGRYILATIATGIIYNIIYGY